MTMNPAKPWGFCETSFKQPAHLSRPLRVANSAMLDRFVCGLQHCILAIGAPGPAEALALFDEVVPAPAALALTGSLTLLSLSIPPPLTLEYLGGG